MRACPWSESVGEGGGGGVIRITVEPSVAANWVTEGSYIRVYVGRYTLWTASATLLSTRRFRNPSQPPGILLWSARQNAIQNPLSTAIGFRPTHYPFCRPFNLIRHDRHWQHDNRVTWQYFDKDSLRRNICRLQFARVYHHYDGYSNRRPMKGLSNFDAQRFNQVRASSDPWNFSYNQIFSRQIFTKQNIIRIRGMSDVIFPLIFLLWSEHCFCSRYPPIRAAPFVHPSRPFRDRTQDRKRNQRILALLCSSVLTNERLSRDKIAPVDSSLAANPHVWARRISIGEFLRERSRSFSPESKRPSLRAFTETRPQNRKLQFLPNVEERTSENASKFIRDRQIFIGQRRTYTRGNSTFGARPKPLLRPGGASNTPDQVTVGSGRHYVAILRAYTQLWYSNLFFLFPPFQKNQARAFPSRSRTPEMSFRFGSLPVCFRVTPCVYAFLFRDCAKYFAWSNYTEGKIFPCLHFM